MLGVTCVEGCPFMIIQIKTRLELLLLSNLQFKASWCTEQLLDLFKTRPHIPSAEFVDIVRKTYKIIISSAFEYKIKYTTHNKLHRSM